MAIDPKDLEEQKKLNELHLEEANLLREKAKAQQEYDISVQQGATNQKKLAETLRDVSARHDKVAEKLDNLRYKTDEAANSQSALKSALVGIGTMMPDLIGQFDSLYGTQINSLTSFSKAIPAVSKFASAIHDTQVELRRSTGFQDRYSRSFTRLRGAYAAINLPQEQVEKNLLALNKNFSAFDALSPAMRDNMTMLAGNFTLLGASGEETAQMLDNLHFAFGITGQAAVEASGDLRGLSKQTGLGMEVLLKDLNQLSPELARFGLEGTRVFAGLAKQARSLGLSTKEVFDVTEQLDTFQGAAEIVGRMNAQFGMQLNSVELMKASHEDRVDILREEFMLQGKSFQSLHKRQKQMLASILGRDVKTVGKLFGQGMDITAFQEDVGKADPMDKFTKFADRASVLNQQIYDEIINKLGGVQTVNDMQIGLLKTMQGNVGIVGDALKALMVVGAGSKMLSLTKSAAGNASASGAGGLGALFKRFTDPTGMTKSMKDLKVPGLQNASKQAGASLVDDMAKGAVNATKSSAFRGAAKILPFGLGGAVSVGMAKAQGQTWTRALVTGISGALAGTAAFATVTGATFGAGAPIGLAAGAAAGYAAESAVGGIYDKIFGTPTPPTAAKADIQQTMKMDGVDMASATSRDTIQLNIQELVVKSSVEVDGDVLGQKTQKYFNTSLNPTMAN